VIFCCTLLHALGKLEVILILILFLDGECISKPIK